MLEMSIISDDNDFKSCTPAVKKNPVVKPEAIELDKILKTAFVQNPLIHISVNQD